MTTTIDACNADTSNMIMPHYYSCIKQGLNKNGGVKGDMVENKPNADLTQQLEKQQQLAERCKLLFELGTIQQQIPKFIDGWHSNKCPKCKTKLPNPTYVRLNKNIHSHFDGLSRLVTGFYYYSCPECDYEWASPEWYYDIPRE